MIRQSSYTIIFPVMSRIKVKSVYSIGDTQSTILEKHGTHANRMSKKLEFTYNLHITRMFNLILSLHINQRVERHTDYIKSNH